MNDTIESASFDSKGDLEVCYQGILTHDLLHISPVPKPRSATIGLHWDKTVGLVLDNADPVGQRFTFSNQTAALRLINSIQLHGPLTVPVRESRPSNDSRALRSRATEGARSTERPIAVDLSQLLDGVPGAFLIVAGKRWVPTAPLPVSGLPTRPQIDSFVASSADARYVAETIARLWYDYKLAGGREPKQFETLAEVVLVQWERKNPSAALGFLQVASRPDGWGLYRLGDRWYNEFGFPILGPGGVYWDHTYAPLERPDWAVKVEINDPELFTLVTYLQQAYAGGTMDAFGAAQGYLRNTDLLVPAVLKDWPFLEELSDEIRSMMPLLVAFLGTDILARILIMLKSPVPTSIGVALKGLIKIGGWALNVTFFGTIAMHAFWAGRELLLVRRDGHDTLDPVSQKHLSRAVALIRKVVVDIATILVAKAAAKAGPGAARGAATVGRTVGRQLQLAIRTDLAPQLAGAYGSGPSFEMVAMSGEPPEDPLTAKSPESGGSGSTGRAPAPADLPPENWRALEKAVIDEFHRGAPENSPKYFTSKHHKLSTIWGEFLAFAKSLQASGNPDPIPKSDPAVLAKTRLELIKDSPLGDECQAQSRWLDARLRAAERRVAASEGKNRKAAELERNKWVDAYGSWIKWLNVKVGDQMLDLLELNPAAREAAVVDPSFAWADRLHNLKSRVYLESLNRLLGWTGGSALDVGRGRFHSRIFFESKGQPKSEERPESDEQPQ